MLGWTLRPRVCVRPWQGRPRFQGYTPQAARPPPPAETTARTRTQGKPKHLPYFKTGNGQRQNKGAGDEQGSVRERFQNSFPSSLTRAWENRLTQLLFYGINCVLICHVIWNNLCSVNGCYGPSMLPTLNVQGDWVLISKLHHRGRWIHVGDLISYDHPVRQGTSAIKRVIGMPGDFVLRDTPGRGEGLMIQIPQGHCWVMGDNIDWTRDSRHFGPLPLSLVRGKVVARVLPWSQRKLLGQEPEKHAALDDG